MLAHLTVGDRVLIASALLILAALLIFDLGTFWQGCNDPNSSAYSYYRTNYDNCSADGVISFILAIGSFTDRVRDDLTAVSTAVIAAFTIILAWATHRQARLTRLVVDAGKESADAAKRSADALPALERAYLFIEIKPAFSDNITFNLDALDRAAQRPGGDTAVITPPPAIEYQFVNHGKTPAIIRGMDARFRHMIELPTEIGYSSEPLNSGNIVVRAGEIYPAPQPIGKTAIVKRFEEQGIITPPFSYYQMRSILSDDIDPSVGTNLRQGRSFLWFFGRIVYDDVFQREHETRFCWYYNGLTNTFQPYERRTGENLNHRT